MSNLSYPVIIIQDEEKVFQVSFPDFPGCVTFGFTYEEAFKNAEDVLKLWISELAKSHAKSMNNRKSQTIISNVSVQFA
jgi:predicted RNase H-like HicB family nuclease